MIVNCLIWKTKCSVYYYSDVYSIDTIGRMNKGVIPLFIELSPLGKGSIILQFDLNGNRVYLQNWQVSYKRHPLVFVGVYRLFSFLCCVELCCFLYILFAFVMFLVCPMLPVSLDCSFCIALSVFSNVYSIRNNFYIAFSCH